jgi:nucleotide-binding universal stress UspA family protein
MPISRPLIAIDLSDASEAAARWVAAVVPAGSEVVLGHVVDVPEPPGFLRALFPQTDTVSVMAEQGAKQQLQALAQRVPLPAVLCDVRGGKAADAILRIAEERAVNAIILGPHGEREGLGHFVGSTAVKVVRQASVPVLVVRGARRAERPQHVLVAVDDSSASVAALRWGAAFANAMGASLHLMTVVNPVLANALGVAASDSERNTALAQVKAVSGAWLEEVVASLPEPRPALTTSVHVGRPADAIFAAATTVGADFIVLGRNASTLNTMLGSVADTVLRHAEVSTAVVPG